MEGQGGRRDRVPDDVDIFVKQGHQRDVDSLLRGHGFRPEEEPGPKTAVVTYKDPDGFKVDVFISETDSKQTKKDFAISDFSNNVESADFGNTLSTAALRSLLEKREKSGDAAQAEKATADLDRLLAIDTALSNHPNLQFPKVESRHLPPLPQSADMPATDTSATDEAGPSRAKRRLF